MRNVDAREEGEFVTRNLLMRLTDRRGNTRERNTFGYRRYFGDERRTVLFYESPANVKGTGFPLVTNLFGTAGRVERAFGQPVVLAGVAAEAPVPDAG